MSNGEWGMGNGVRVCVERRMSNVECRMKYPASITPLLARRSFAKEGGKIPHPHSHSRLTING
jgi:hypothetical protein